MAASNCPPSPLPVQQEQTRFNQSNDPYSSNDNSYRSYNRPGSSGNTQSKRRNNNNNNNNSQRRPNQNNNQFYDSYYSNYNSYYNNNDDNQYYYSSQYDYNQPQQKSSENASHQTSNKNAVDSTQQQQQQRSKNKSNQQNQNLSGNKNQAVNTRETQANKSQSVHKNVKVENQQPQKPSKKAPDLKKQKSVSLYHENETRSEILMEQLSKSKYECMVCCFAIKTDAAIWNCNVCYHVFHLFCIKKWARSPAAIVDESTQNWRCPGCQAANEAAPNKYKCFCGKKVDPEFNKEITPHSCGEVCAKPKTNPNNPTCVHKCNVLCHPGPCAPCEAMIYRQCGCGKLKFQVKCNSNKIPQCDDKCSKTLNCGIHSCNLGCHANECPSCDIDVELKCFSHEKSKIVKCGSLSNPKEKQFKCSEICNRLLDCKEHYCTNVCHDGDCDSCVLLPQNLKSCPCGKTAMSDLTKNQARIKCTDLIPTCERPCEKVLSCSDFSNSDLHYCQLKCHHGECLKCEKNVKLSCRCGSKSEEMPCHEAQMHKINPLTCEKRCTKKQSCGRHKCSEVCCGIKDHICTLICNRGLNCGKHNCEQLCHKGNCLKCPFSSYDEWICDCGKTIVYPPIKCGTKLPDCPYPCQRQRTCEHPVQHSCHQSEPCPPCSFLTNKMCMGNHEMRHNIPCYLKDVSCGLPCGKELPCGKHKCIKTCHKGSCLEEGEACSQPCQAERPHCVHACMSACHTGTCPDTICQAIVIAKCKCGLKSKQMKCLQKYCDESVVFENLASEIKDMLSCKTIDINTFRNTEVMKKKHELQCDEECLIAERNRSLAQALQIDPNNPAPKQPMKILYSDFLKNFVREDPQFVMYVEKELAQLIKDLSTSKLPKKCFSFPTMKSMDRRFVHELATTYYNLESESHDKEPNRCVKVYATKEKSTVPAQTLSQSVELKPKQPTIPLSAAKIKAIKLPPSMPLYNQENYIEIKPSSFAVLQDLNDSDTDEILSSSQNTITATKSKGQDIDYFDVTD